MTNYAMLGEYTAFSEQAKDAARRRFACMHNLGQTLMNLSERAEMPFDETAATAQLSEIQKADIEMRAALERANQAAKLCGKPELTLAKLLKS